MLRSYTGLSRCLVRRAQTAGCYMSRRLYSNAVSLTAHIPPAMLNRAQSISSEYIGLKEQLSNDYNTKIARKAGELSKTAETYKQWMDACTALTELQELLTDPGSDEDLRSIAKDEVDFTVQRVQQLASDLKASLAPVHPFAQFPCLLELRPGAGGSEAGLFAAELLRMYQAYCRRNQLRASVLSLATSEVGGEEQIQEAVLKIDDEGAYETLRCEAGVHRVQRVPATETKGRTHTSAVQVLVLPSFPEQSTGEIDFNDPESDYYIHPSDVETETMRARGAGGQHVNTTDSAVRLRHLPSGTVVSVQESRSQQANRAKAWQILRSRVAQAKREKREEEQASVRRGIAGKGKMDRGDKVRTYNWGQQRVTDHRSGLTTHALTEVMNGDTALDEVMTSVKAWMVEKDLETLAAEKELKAS